MRSCYNYVLWTSPITRYFHLYRLAEQLAGWMSRHQERRKTEKKPDRQKEKELRPISTLKRAMRGDMRVPRNKYMR